jgi:hypothetical protein
MDKNDNYLVNPSIVVSQWIPLGKNNITALNRFIGSHKKYKSPTEFGIEGSLDSLSKGSFKMDKNGVLLKPVGFDFSNYIDLIMTDSFGDVALHLDYTGYSRLGFKVGNSTDKLSVSSIKSHCSDLNLRLVEGFYPVLSRPQRSLLESLYGSDNIINEYYKSSGYALIIAEDFTGSEEDIPQLTDWITETISYRDCKIYIGMNSTLCIGTPDENVLKILDHIAFTQTLFTITQRLFSRLNSCTRQLESSRENITGAKLNKLKRISTTVSDISTDFSRLEVVDSMLKLSISEKKEELIGLKNHETDLVHDLLSRYKDEEDKTEDRALLLSYLKNELDGLNDDLNLRMDQLISKNGDFMNIVLLIMTILTVVGFGDIFGLNFIQRIIIIAIMVPFSLVAMLFIKDYLKSYKKKK